MPGRDRPPEGEARLKDVRIKRIYEPAAVTDGQRILIDRPWPRGFTHEDAHGDDWLRDLGPSTELRRWFAHDEACFAEFRRRYAAELLTKTDELAELRRRARKRAR